MKRQKLTEKILSASADNNIPFNPTVSLLKRLGFDLDISGSHYIFTLPGIEGQINIQQTKESKIKGYQVKQIRLYFNRNGIK